MLNSLHEWLIALDAINPSTAPEALRGTTRLNLAAKEIETLHPGLALLTSLVHLDLRRNRLKSLPEWIGTLGLRSLNLSGNRLNTATELASCTQLRVLDLSANALSDTTDLFDNMTELRSLNLAFNALVHFALPPLENLEHLNLSSNFLRELDPSISALRALLSLDLSNNQIETISATQGFENLDRFDLSSNTLEQLHLGGCDMLESLTIDDNPGVALSFEAGFAPDLRHFSAVGCQLAAWIVPDSKALEILSLASNALDSDMLRLENCPMLHELDLEDNDITTINDALDALPKLETLFIDVNPLSPGERARISARHLPSFDLDIKKAITIENATEADIESMARLLAQLFAIEQDFTIDFEAQKKGLSLLLQERQTFVCVARFQERVIGMVTMQQLISTAAGGPIGQIEDLVVDSEYRSLGVGNRLLEQMIHNARERAYHRLQLGADISNLRALDFYRKRGFAKTHLNIYHLPLS